MKRVKLFFLVVGMCQNGTSAITRFVNLFGVHIASSLLQPLPDNSKGYWKSIDLYFYESLLKNLVMFWDSVLPVQNTWANYIGSLNWVKNYIKGELVQYDSLVIKDPHLS